VRLPAKRPDIGPVTARLRARTQVPHERDDRYVPLELEELQLQVGGRPEEQPVQAFAPNRADQALDEGTVGRHLIVHAHHGPPAAALRPPGCETSSDAPATLPSPRISASLVRRFVGGSGTPPV
jgi:hypothetical protein